MLTYANEEAHSRERARPFVLWITIDQTLAYLAFAITIGHYGYVFSIAITFVAIVSMCVNNKRG